MDAWPRFARLVARAARGAWPALARPDDGFAAAYLVGGELDAYRGMDRRDRDHGCRVARRLLAARPDAEAVWIRAALLHDVGKSIRPYRVWERVLVHLLTPGERTCGHLPAAWVAVLAAHRRHAREGAERLRTWDVDPRVVELVARHHDPVGDDEGLRQLVAADEAS